MRTRNFDLNFSTTSRAALFMLSCAGLLPAAAVQAQTYSELQDLAFYPVPLGASAQPPVIAAAATNHATGASVPMAGLQNATFDGSGFYAPELAQQLTQAGLLHQQSNEHEQAISNLEKAAAASRIQNGLYSSEQALLAERTIQSLLALGRLDEAQDKYEQLLNISRKFYGRRSRETAHALLGLGQLQVDRLQLDRTEPELAFDTLYQAQVHFVDAARILIDAEAWTDPAIVALEDNLIRTYYIDAVRTHAVETPLTYALDDESSHSRMRSRANRAGAPEQFFKGEQAYLRMAGYLQKNPNADTGEIADVLLGLADWNLLFGNQVEADAHYQRLLALGEAAPAALLNPAVPVPLPAFADSPLAPGALPETSAARGYIDVSFTVDRHGRATQFAVLGTSDAAAPSIVSRFETLVRNSRFRPSGAADTDYKLRYFFSY
jgi:tetratricopeptide (TPR) repeat protein